MYNTQVYTSNIYRLTKLLVKFDIVEFYASMSEELLGQ